MHHRIILVIAMISQINSTAHASDPTPSAASPQWAIEAAATAPGASGLAENQKQDVLVWITGDTRHAAEEVYLLVEKPFDQIQPAIQEALSRLGQFEYNQREEPLSEISPEWIQVLLAHRPEVRAELAQEFEYPKLERAHKTGAITAEEVQQRMARARENLDYLATYRGKHAAFKVPYKFFSANQDKVSGFFGGSASELYVWVLDVSAVFGHSATAVRISRSDTYPNPALKKPRKFNMLSTTSAKVGGRAVPAKVFEAVRTCLTAASGEVPPRIAPLPQAWVEPVAPAAAERKPVLVAPRHADAAIAAETVNWGLNSRLSSLYRLLPLPDGDVLVSVEAGLAVTLQRLHADAGGWRAQTVWQGADSVRDLAISADGRTVWFRGASGRDATPRMHAYDVKTHNVRSYNTVRAEAGRAIDARRRDTPAEREDDWKTANKSLQSADWELTGTQLPVFFEHVIGAGLLGGNQFEVVASAGLPASEAVDWTFHTATRNGRETYVRQHPVRWRDRRRYWTEDSIGINELESDSGRILRAIPLPPRNGGSQFSQGYPEYQHGPSNTPPPSGMAPWVPTSLGSPEAGWIAVGFMILSEADSKLEKGGSHPSDTRAAQAADERYFGMHVVDTERGALRFSALLGTANSLSATARSAHGRLLALAADRNRVALWDIRTGVSPVALSGPYKDLRAVAFSWDGVYLWAVYRDGLRRWKLPAAIRDAATAGNFPDQSHD
jgi:hypothetical protein